jgi:hypothetical protein
MPVERKGQAIASEIGSTGNGRNPIIHRPFHDIRRWEQFWQKINQYGVPQLIKHQ